MTLSITHWNERLIGVSTIFNFNIRANFTKVCVLSNIVQWVNILWVCNSRSSSSSSIGGVQNVCGCTCWWKQQWQWMVFITLCVYASASVIWFFDSPYRPHAPYSGCAGRFFLSRLFLCHSVVADAAAVAVVVVWIYQPCKAVIPNPPSTLRWW